MTTYTLPGRLSRLYPGLSFSSKGGSHPLIFFAGWCSQRLSRMRRTFVAYKS
jgi:hypothetical protein